MYLTEQELQNDVNYFLECIGFTEDGTPRLYNENTQEYTEVSDPSVLSVLDALTEQGNQFSFDNGYDDYAGYNNFDPRGRGSMRRHGDYRGQDMNRYSGDYDLPPSMSRYAQRMHGGYSNRPAPRMSDPAGMRRNRVPRGDDPKAGGLPIGGVLGGGAAYSASYAPANKWSMQKYKKQRVGLKTHGRRQLRASIRNSASHKRSMAVAAGIAGGMALGKLGRYVTGD